MLHHLLSATLLVAAACTSPDAPEPSPRAASPESTARVEAKSDAWGVEDRQWEGAGGAVSRLVEVDTGAHEGYDRIAFTFDGPLPAYEVGYPETPVAACGSGNPVGVAGTPLVVRFHGASAHTDTGAPTIVERDRQPALTSLQSLRLTCDFEAEVAWAAGMSGREPFRVFTLDAPPRVVIDIAHPGTR